MCRIFRLPATLVAFIDRCAVRLLCSAFGTELALVYCTTAAGPTCIGGFRCATLGTEFAPVIEKSERGLKLDVCKWGYPLAKGNNLVINARTESVMDKIAFRNGLLYHRILIPASGFYEWNRLKEKNTFTRPDAPVLYMAGFCDWFENEKRFVILTTKANASMEKTHDRMPLILEKEQLADWFDDKKMEQLLQHTPVMLKRESNQLRI